tara:strand:- start:142 stop:741 length:600 start_codon:yes stop_codon:yes gene_type:complete
MSVLVSREAPEFTASAVMPDGSINAEFKLSDYKGQYVVLYFYPLDFTFVCPSEIIEFDRKLEEFKSRNAQVIGVSVDSQFSHAAWKKTAIKDGGIGDIQYPLVADLNHEITAAYGIGHSAAPVAMRASFLIDKEGIVQHQVVNNLPLGRNIDEMIRMVDALQFTEEHGEVCPVNWNKGKSGMTPTAEGVASYLSENFSK